MMAQAWQRLSNQYCAKGLMWQEATGQRHQSVPVGHQPSSLSELVLEKRTALGYAFKGGVLTLCKQLPLPAGFLPLTEQARGRAKGRQNKDEGVVWVVDRPCSNPPSLADFLHVLKQEQ